MIRKILTVLALIVASTTASEAQERHAMMEGKWWLTAGWFIADQDFEASARGTVVGIDREFDLEGSLGLDQSPDLFMGELGWQFGENWGLALQYFQSSRDASKVLEDTFEWQGNTYDVGALVEAESKMEITRIFFARRFRDNGPHSLRLGVGLHWLSVSAEVAGQATLNDNSTEFRRAAAATEFPIPNIGAWYRYSPSKKWLFNARLDWLSASIDDYSGEMWNVSGGVAYSLFDNFSIGANYQFFEISGSIKDDNWRGDLAVTYTGPYLYIAGHW